MGNPDPSQSPNVASLAGKRICLTGGAGFIGGHLADALLLIGARITVLDDLSNTDGERIASLVDTHRDACRFIYGSILDPTALREAITSAEIVFHLAALNSVPRSIEMPERTFEVNAVGTLRVAEAARRAGVRRLIYAASSSAYGDDPTLPKVETMLPRPLSPYAASKLAGESIIRAWSHSYGLSAISLRYFNVFGPRQRADDAYAGVVPAFITKLLAGEPPVIFGDGSASRDFTPVANIVHANLLAAVRRGELRGEVVNIGLGRSTTIRELADVLARLTDRTGIEPILKNERIGDVPHSLADLHAARERIGYQPVRLLEAGLAETVAWFSQAAAQTASA